MLAGSPSSSFSHSSATLSSAETAGVTESKAAFWSQAAASQLAASAAGSEPPMTKPKKRGPAMRHGRRRAHVVEQPQHVSGIARACRQRLPQRGQARNGFG